MGQANGKIRNFDNSVTCFTGTCGLRQGCPNSPTMFLFVIDSLIRKIALGPSVWIPGVQNRDLDKHNDGQSFVQAWYADDGAVMAQSPYALQRQVDAIIEWTKAWGLALNHSKCVSMLFSGKHETNTWAVNIEGNKINQQDEFLYLGCLLNRSTSAIAMGHQRLRIAYNRITTLKTMCRRLWYATQEVRMRACHTIAEGTTLYACELWAEGSLIGKTRRILGKVAQMILGSSYTSSRVTNSMELNLIDFAAMVRSRRLKWTWRVMQFHSPTRTLAETSWDTSTVMGKIREDTYGSGISPLAFQALSQNDQRIMVRQWSDKMITSLKRKPDKLNYTLKNFGTPREVKFQRYHWTWFQLKERITFSVWTAFYGAIELPGYLENFNRGAVFVVKLKSQNLQTICYSDAHVGGERGKGSLARSYKKPRMTR